MRWELLQSGGGAHEVAPLDAGSTQEKGASAACDRGEQAASEVARQATDLLLRTMSPAIDVRAPAGTPMIMTSRMAST